MIDIAETYRQLCEVHGMPIDPEYKIFTVQCFPGGAIAIVPGKPTRGHPEMTVRATVDCDPEMIKDLIREVLAEAF